jgi:hypothetical protein
MKVLFNDIFQYSNIRKELKSPALSEISNVVDQMDIVLDKTRPINSIGIGNTNGTYFDLLFDNDINYTIQFSANGLYILPRVINASKIMITTDATFIGRLGAGIGCNIPTSIAKEPAFCSTAESRLTLSGQIVEGKGGYNYRTISLDSRYKIDEYILNEIKEGYKYIGKDYPFFIDLSVESYKIPFSKLYANERNQNQMSFEGGIRRFLYSRRWEFEERF